VPIACLNDVEGGVKVGVKVEIAVGVEVAVEGGGGSRSRFGVSQLPQFEGSRRVISGT
jgi:hypothetical protein